MGNLRIAALLASALLVMAGSSAQAADIPEPPPPKVHKWYLRGHIGMSNQNLNQLEHVLFSNPDFFEWLDKGDFDSAPVFGFGVGVYYNDFLRFDIVGEYRGKASFAAQDRYDTDSNPPDFDGGVATAWGINDYTAKKSEYLLMANAYYDIGAWYGVTPYVGVGVGASYNVISNFRDNNIIQGGGGEAGTAGMWNLAWAFHAGIGFQATENTAIDLGYSFVNLGDAKTGTLMNLNGTCSACQPMYFRGLRSHDLKLTVRYDFDQAAGQYPEPIYFPEPEIVKY